MTKRKVHAEDQPGEEMDQAQPARSAEISLRTPDDAPVRVMSTRLDAEPGKELALHADTVGPLRVALTTHTIRTTMRPDAEITVSDQEYLSLLQMGLVYDGTPPDPVADPFDARVAEFLAVTGSSTQTAIQQLVTGAASGVQDPYVAGLVGNAGSATSGALRAAFVPTSEVWDGTQIADNNSFLDWTHDTSTGSYLLHLRTGPNSNSGSLLALGVGDGGASGTNGLLVSVKAAASSGAAGVAVVNATGSVAWGLHGQQNSANAPLVFLEQTGTNVAPALTLTANGTPGAGQLLQRWQSGAAGGDIGGVRADTGDFEWQRNLTTQDRVGGTRQHVGVSSDSSIGADSRDHSQLYKESLDFYRSSGTPGLWWSARVDANANTLRLRAGGPTDTVGTPSGLNTLIEIKSDGIGFFGHTPAPQPARPATLADVIAALAGLGITA